MKIFALAGFKGSGKDTLARIICEHFKEQGFRAYRMAFAEKIRYCIMDAFNLDSEDEYDQFKRGEIKMPDGHIVSGRTILRGIGGHMRACNEDQFVEDVDFKIKHLEDPDNTIVVITDLRYKNEIKWCKTNDAIIIKLTREGTFSDGHISEQEIDDFLCDFVWENNGNENDLRSLVQQNL